MDRYWVYILSNHSRTLYVGVTNHLERRVLEHKTGQGSTFTRRYRLRRLVYFEDYPSIEDALRREKQLKRWRREKKVALIEQHNAGWHDLAAHLHAPTPPRTSS